MRLIDADKMIEFINMGHLRSPSELCYSEIDVVNMLLHANIAYDLDSVLKRLEEMTAKPTELQYDVPLIRSIIEIVRGGLSE